MPEVITIKSYDPPKIEYDPEQIAAKFEIVCPPEELVVPSVGLFSIIDSMRFSAPYIPRFSMSFDEAVPIGPIAESFLNGAMMDTLKQAARALTAIVQKGINELDENVLEPLNLNAIARSLQC